MTYALLDDKTYRAVALRECGAMAALLHTVALMECAQIDGDGVLTQMMVKDAAGLYDIPARAKHAARLVDAGVWHDARTLGDCADCSEGTESLPAGAFLIHRWWDPLLHKAGKDDPVKRQRELRRKQLWRNKALVGAIRQRDKDLCRYCGIPCGDPSGPNKKDPSALTLDHLDPWGENTLANVVVACRRCNGLKKDRTPQEAGMVLLRSGTRVGSSDTVPDRTSDTDQPHGGDARETGQVGHGSGRGGAGAGPRADTHPTLEGASA